MIGILTLRTPNPDSRVTRASCAHALSLGNQFSKGRVARVTRPPLRVQSMTVTEKVGPQPSWAPRHPAGLTLASPWLTLGLQHSSPRCGFPVGAPTSPHSAVGCNTLEQRFRARTKCLSLSGPLSPWPESRRLYFEAGPPTFEVPLFLCDVSAGLKPVDVTQPEFLLRHRIVLLGRNPQPALCPK